MHEQQRRVTSAGPTPEFDDRRGTPIALQRAVSRAHHSAVQSPAGTRHRPV